MSHMLRHLFGGDDPVALPLFVGGGAHQNTGVFVPLGGPPETLVGDLLAGIAVSVGANAAWAPPAGFTEALDPTNGADFEAIYGIAAHDGAWSYNASTSTSNNKSSAMLAFRDAAVDVVGGGVGRAGVGALPLPSVTLSEPGVIVALIVSSGPGGTHAPPDDAMELGALQAGSGYPVASAWFERVGAGPSGTRTFAIGGVPGNTSGLMLGVVPA